MLEERGESNRPWNRNRKAECYALLIGPSPGEFVAGGDCQSAADLIVILTFRPGPKFVSVVGAVFRAVGARTFLGPHCWHTKKTEEHDKAYIRFLAQFELRLIPSGLRYSQAAYMSETYTDGFAARKRLIGFEHQGRENISQKPVSGSTFQ
jgi:hypothetical protein